MKVTSNKSKPIIFEYLPASYTLKTTVSREEDVFKAVEKLQPCIRIQVQTELGIGKTATLRHLNTLSEKKKIKYRMAKVTTGNNTVICPVYEIDMRKKK